MKLLITTTKLKSRHFDWKFLDKLNIYLVLNKAELFKLSFQMEIKLNSSQRETQFVLTVVLYSMKIF